MIEYNICTKVQVVNLEELEERLRNLVLAAKHATQNSYAPYSHFHVGAALLLENGEVVTGSNQENASYPVGCCAERTALFWCGANKHGVAIKAIAIAAENRGDFTASPTSPCGMCRQALLEVEQQQGTPIMVVLYGADRTYILENIEALLPLSFSTMT